MSAPSSRFVEAKTIVFWDIEDCQIPDGVNAHLIYDNIKSALGKMNYRGTVSIRAYGDKNLFPDIFHSLGITPGDKHARVTKIISDMFIWAFDHYGESLNLMVISSADSECFITSFCYLKERLYNILLAQSTQNVSEPLLHSVSSVWLWRSLLAGGNPLETKAKAQVPRDTVTRNSSRRYSSSPRRYRSRSRSPSPRSTPRRYDSSSSFSSPRRYRSRPRRYGSSSSGSSLRWYYPTSLSPS